MTRRKSRAWAFLATGALALGSGARLLAEPTGDWPQFRGPNRDGVSPETGLLDEWPEAGPKEVWRHPIGEGYSAISIAGGRLYTMYAEAPETGASATAEGDGPGEGAPAPDAPVPKTEYAASFDAATGARLWRTAVGERLVTEFGNGPRSTPTVAGDGVYVMGAHGDLAALAAEDGELRWQLNLTEAFGGSRPYWGSATSALVEDGLLIVQAGGPDGKSYAGLDKATGEVRWTSGDGRAGYNSPLAVNLGGERRFVYVAGQSFRAVDAEGKEVFSHPWPEGETHAMPIFVSPDRFFASGAEGIGAVMMRVTRDGDGLKVEELWKNPLMRNHFSSSVIHGGHVYGFDVATLKCLSLETGELAWARRGLGKGSLIYADGHLLVLSDRGKLVQIEATPEGYVEKGSVQALEGRCWTAPTLAGGRLYLRNHREMVSYDLKG